MKKKRIAGLLLLLPLTLLSACGGGTSTLALSANWYKNTTVSTLEGTSERLVYSVRLVPPEKQGNYHVVYNEGTYTTELVSYPYTFDDNSSATVYRYTTTLSISGYYTNGNVNSETFEDYSRYTVYFRGVDDNLCPISSTKEMKSTIPVGKPSDEVLCDVVRFTLSVTYNTAKSNSAKLESAEVKVVAYGDTEEENRERTDTVKISYSGTFLDNEQILFAMRGLDMTSAATMMTINPQTGKTVKVYMPSTPSSTDLTMTDLTINGELQGELNEGLHTLTLKASKVPYQYKTDQSGPTRTAYYAVRSDDAENNPYRNVLLRLDDTIPGGYGTLRYTLKSATFNDK